jgi:hypothetical protein
MWRAIAAERRFLLWRLFVVAAPAGCVPPWCDSQLPTTFRDISDAENGRFAAAGAYPDPSARAVALIFSVSSPTPQSATVT